MNQLHGRVLELFLKDKKDNKIRNIVYGKKALEKYVDASFKNRDEKDKKKYLKQWNSSKLSNSVYFVYQSGDRKGHRFISNASKKGGYSYLGHLESNNGKSFKKRKSVKRRKTTQRGGYPFWFDDVPKGMSRAQYMKLSKSKPKNKSMKVWIKENKKKKTKAIKKSKRSIRRKRTQKGGYCPPCLIPPVVSAMGLGTAGYLASRSSSEKIVNGKKSVKRKEIYKIKKNDKKLKKIFIQNGLNLKLAGKKVKARTMREATKKFNEAINKCIQSGFRKC